MLQKQTTKPRPRRPEIRRCVRRVDTLPDGKAMFKTKSFTKDDGTTYEPIIDPQTGEFSCTCADHVYRRRACKHILRAVTNLLRDKGFVLASELEVAPKGATDAEARDYWRSLSDEELEAMAPPLPRGEHYHRVSHEELAEMNAALGDDWDADFGGSES